MSQLKFPSHKETLKFIEELNKEEWEKYDGKNLEGYLKKIHLKMTNICQLYSSFYLSTPHINPFDFKFFRARSCDQIKNNSLRCEYSYPPITFTTKNLRANLIGAPVFYASDNPIVALLEFIQQWDSPENYAEKEYVISRWKIKNNNQLFIAPFIPQKLNDINEYAVLAKFTNEEFRIKTGQKYITDDEINGIREMKEYFSNLFIKDEERTISSYLGHTYVYENPFGNSIFIYPSLKAKHEKINFAIHPNFADEMMDIAHIYRIKLNSILDENDLMSVKFQLIDIAFNINSKLTWTSIKEHERLVKILFKNDFEFELKT